MCFRCDYQISGRAVDQRAVLNNQFGNATVDLQTRQDALHGLAATWRIVVPIVIGAVVVVLINGNANDVPILLDRTDEDAMNEGQLEIGNWADVATARAQSGDQVGGGGEGELIGV